MTLIFNLALHRDQESSVQSSPQPLKNSSWKERTTSSKSKTKQSKLPKVTRAKVKQPSLLASGGVQGGVKLHIDLVQESDKDNSKLKPTVIKYDEDDGDHFDPIKDYFEPAKQGPQDVSS